MKIDEAIEIAKKSGLSVQCLSWSDSEYFQFSGNEKQFLKAIEIVIQSEREACAKVCDNIDLEYEGDDVLATWCSAAIRARGKA
jgi:hypothetical protein